MLFGINVYIDTLNGFTCIDLSEENRYNSQFYKYLYDKIRKHFFLFNKLCNLTIFLYALGDLNRKTIY